MLTAARWCIGAYGVPRPKSANDTVTSLNCPGEWLERVQQLADTTSRRVGATIARADMLRKALLRGIEELEAEESEIRARERTASEGESKRRGRRGSAS
jgi:hypothetical protein